MENRGDLLEKGLKVVTSPEEYKMPNFVGVYIL